MYECEIELDLNKQYSMPESIVEKYMDGNILVISVETGNWIVLKNDTQKKIYNQLKDKTIDETIEFMKKNRIPEEELIAVLTELEAKHFEDTIVKYTEKNGLYIYLTNKCNLRCQHCYVYAGDELSEELSTEEIIYILNKFKIYGGRVVTFTGGEVTERTDIRKILKVAKELDLIVNVLTNGTNWDDSLIEETYKLIDEIQISIDGFDEKSNARIRGEGYFNQSLNTVDKFIRRNIKVRVAVTPLLDDLKEDEHKFIEFGKNLLEKYKGKDFHLKFNLELLNGRNIIVNKGQNEKYSKIMSNIVETCYPGSKQIDFVLNHKDNTVLDNCGYGGITISATGDIYFCNRISEVNKYGNIRNMSFEKILELSQKAMSLSNINNLQPCCVCELKYICGGGCKITFFNDLVKLKSLDDSQIRFNARACNSDQKHQIYKLMIETNEALYR